MARWKHEKPSPKTKAMRDWLDTEAGQTYQANRAAYMRTWRKNNPTKRKAIQQRSYDKIRNECFEAYGGARCKCCGEDEIKFLHLDHVNGDGAAHRRQIGIAQGDMATRKRTTQVITLAGGTGFYYWLKKNGWPDIGLQVLCANCNLGKRTGKYCPHEIKRGIDLSGNPIDKEL